MGRSRRSARTGRLRRESATELLLAGPNLFGQGIRFAAAGGTVALVYLGSTTLLANVAGLPFEAALALGFAIAMSVHFTLQRLFVWAQGDAYALSLRHQAVRYLVMSGLQYGVTAASIAVLPGLLGVDTEIVYLATVVIVVGINFLVFRNAIFHSKAP